MALSASNQSSATVPAVSLSEQSSSATVLAPPNLESSPTAGVSGVPVAGSMNPGTVPSSRAVLSFPDDPLLWATFAALNVVLCTLTFSFVFPASSAAAPVAEWVRIAVTGVFSLLVLPTVVLPMARRALRQLDRGLVSLEIIETIGLGLLFGLLVFGLGWQFEALRQQPVLNSFPVVVFVVALGQAARQKLERWFTQSMELDVVRAAPLVAAYRAGQDQPVIVSVADIRESEEVQLNAGDLVPVDGVVVKGGGEVYERQRSGFGEMAVKGVGQEIFAGSLLVSGSIRCRVTAEARDAEISDFLERLPYTVSGPAANADSLAKTAALRSSAEQHWVNLAIIFFAGCGLVYWARHGGSGLDSDAFFAWSTAISILFAATVLQPLWLIRQSGFVAMVRAFLSGALVRRPAVWRSLAASKTTVLDGAPEIAPQAIALKEFVLVDRRLDESSVMALLVLLFGRYGGPEASAIMQALRPKLKKLSFFKVEDFRRFERCGMTASVEGADITIGGEEILIPRGVQLQATEVYEPADNELPIYVAIGDEVAARLVLVNAAHDAAREAIDALHRYGIRTLLMGRAHQAELDRRGKELSLELAHITGGLAESTYADRLKGLRPVVLCGAAGLSPVVRAEASVNVTLFDQVRWNIDECDVVICRHDIRALPALVRLAKLVGWVEVSGVVGIVTLALVALAAAAFGVAGPTITVALGLLSVGLSAVLFRIVAGPALQGLRSQE